MIDAADEALLRSSGREPDEIRRQLAVLAGPAPRAALVRPCTLGDGIAPLDAAPENAVDRWAAAARSGRLLSFVPASGAATRMVGEIVDLAKPLAPAWVDVLCGLPRLALWSEAERAGAVAGHAEATRRALVGPGGLRLQERPKGLVPFHPGPGGPRTPVAEHLVDALALARDGEGVTRVHLTVGSEHVGAFRSHVDAVAAASGARLEVGLSVQDPATDTVALDPERGPLRDAAGRLVLRPGGHGALLRNLGDVARAGADVVLVRNVDNVIADGPLRAAALEVRQQLVGWLVAVQDEAWAHVHALRGGPSPTHVAAARAFAGRVLGWTGPDDALLARLHRPWRVAGMVRNEGQPGGGPFFVAGEASPQIVEQAHVDLGDPGQAAILARSTHFNPVELVLGLRDVDGRPFDLGAYADPGAAFVSSKKVAGRDVRVLEHPGLWNGQMARWNSVFVEVPAGMFQPVKTLLDLARAAHGGWRA